MTRFRLRKKTWKNPGTVFLDYHVYEEDINISSNWEVFLEVLDGKNTLHMQMERHCFLVNYGTQGSGIGRHLVIRYQYFRANVKCNLNSVNIVI